MTSFRVFWVFALLSNTAAAAHLFIISWQLSDLTLPSGLLVLRQVVSAVGAVVGVVLGAWLIGAFGYRSTLVLTSVVEGLAALSILPMTWGASAPLSFNQGVGVALVSGLLPLGASAGGAAWIALVVDWPDSVGRSQQLLQDSIQFQLGRTVGPLAGALLLGIVAKSLLVASIVNSLTFFVVAAVVLKAVPPPSLQVSGTVDHKYDYRGWVKNLGSPLMVTFIVMAVCADAGRAFLPRVMRLAGAEAGLFSWTVTMGAVGAVAAASIGLRLNESDRRLALFGSSAVLTAMCCWAAAFVWWPLWLVGSLILGAGISVGTSGITAMLIAQVGKSQAASGVNLSRTVFGLAGGAVLALVSIAAGAFTFAVLVPLALYGTIRCARLGKT